MLRIHEELKIDFPLEAQALDNSNVTGRYVKLEKYREALFVLDVATMAATKTANLEVLQATDADGTSAKGIPTTVGQEATAEITANTKVSVATLTFSSIVDTDAFVINGLTFTCEDTDPAVSSRQFASGANDTAAAENAAAVINDPTYGVPGVTASADTGVITLVADDGYDITVTTADATITLATVDAFAYVSVKGSDLDIENDFVYIAPKVTITSTSVVAVALLRGKPRYEVAQGAGASAVL